MVQLRETHIAWVSALATETCVLCQYQDDHEESAVFRLACHELESITVKNKEATKLAAPPVRYLLLCIQHVVLTYCCTNVAYCCGFGS